VIDHVCQQAETLLAADELTPEQRKDVAGLRDVSSQLGELR
jgi:hypothetical protein